MKLVKLKFPSVQLLWQFRIKIGAPKFILDAASKTLVCCCTEANTALAVAEFDAVIVSEKTISLEN